MSDRPPTREDGPEAPASPKPSIVEVAAWLRRAAEEGHELDGGTTAAEPEGAPAAPEPAGNVTSDQPELEHPPDGTDSVLPEPASEHEPLEAPHLSVDPPPDAPGPAAGPPSELAGDSAAETAGAVDAEAIVIPAPEEAPAPEGGAPEGGAPEGGAPDPADRQPDEDVGAAEPEGAAAPTVDQRVDQRVDQQGDPPGLQPGLAEVSGQGAPPGPEPPPGAEAIVVGGAMATPPAVGPATAPAEEAPVAAPHDGPALTPPGDDPSLPGAGTAEPEKLDQGAPGGAPDEPQLSAAPPVGTLAAPPPPAPLTQQDEPASTSDRSVEAASSDTSAEPTAPWDPTELTLPDAEPTPGAGGAESLDVGAVRPPSDPEPTIEPTRGGSTTPGQPPEGPAPVRVPQADPFDLELAQMAERARASAAVGALSPDARVEVDDLEDDVKEEIGGHAAADGQDEPAQDEPAQDEPAQDELAQDEVVPDEAMRLSVTNPAKQTVPAPVELQPVPAAAEAEATTEVDRDIEDEPAGDLNVDDAVGDAPRQRRAPRPSTAAERTTYPRGQLKERIGILQRIRAMLGVVVVTVLLGVAAGAAVGAFLLFLAMTVRSAITSG